MYKLRWVLGLGILFLATSPITMFTSASNWVTLGKALVGVALIVIWFVVNRRRILTPAPVVVSGGAGGADAPKSAMGGASRATFFFVSTGLISIIAVGLLAGVNFIVNKRDKTWDLTAKKVNSLAPQTESTLKSLKEPVKAIGFIGQNDPQREGLDYWLKRYARLSDKFTYELRDPEVEPDLVKKYSIRPGSPTVVLVRGEGDKETHDAVSITQLARGGAEQELTNALVKLDKVGEQKIYFVTGHGEWPTEQPAGGMELEKSAQATEFKASLVQDGYSPDALNIAQKGGEIPKDASAVIIAGARTPFAESEVAALEKYLEKGGRLLYFADDSGEPGLDALLAKYGIQVDPGLLADTSLSPRQPYIIFSTSFAQHEAVRLQTANVQFLRARGLSPVTQGILPGVTPTPLVLTFPSAWEESTPSANPTQDQGEKAGQIPMVIASEKSTADVAEKRFDSARVVVFGDSDILVDSAWGHEGNRNLVLNAIAWSTQQTTRITIRPPDRDISTLDLDDAMMAKIRFISIDLVPVLLVGVGLSLWLARRNK